MVATHNRLRGAVERHARSVFMTAILLYTVLLIYTLFSYSPEARLFPLIASVLLIGLILIEAVLSRYKDKIRFTVDGVFSQTAETPETPTQPASEKNVRREVEMVGWIAGFVLVIWLFGFLASLVLVPVFVYVYQRDLRVAGYTFVAVVILLVTFVYLLSARLWTGAIFGFF